MFFNPVVQGVPADAQDARPARIVPTRLVQSLYERIALKIVQSCGRGEGDRRAGAGRARQTQVSGKARRRQSQVMRLDHNAGAEPNCLLEDIAQFAHIAGSRMRKQCHFRILREHRHALAIAS